MPENPEEFLHQYQEPPSYFGLPFTPELIQWIEENPEVKEALRIDYERFKVVPGISVINCPGGRKIIGVFAIDLERDNKVKQDFILIDNSKYILYTTLKKIDRGRLFSKNVRPLSELKKSFGAIVEKHYPEDNNGIPVDLKLLVDFYKIFF